MTNIKKYEPTPNIPWGWETDEAGNTRLYIRASDGTRTEVVLTPREAEAFSVALGSEVRTKANSRMRQEPVDHAQHMYVGRGDL